MKILDANTYIPKENDNFLFDTNILLKLFSPIIQEEMFGYDNFFDLARKKQAKLILSSIQISEFINRCIRTQFNLYKNDLNRQDLDFKKDYRPTDDYKKTMNFIFDVITEDMLPYFDCIDDGFSKMDRSEIFLKDSVYDFNDALIEQIAVANNSKIVTADFDYSLYAFKHEIVTSNPHLLKFSKKL